MKTKHTKQIKILGKYRASRALTGPSRATYKIVPWLTVNGLWLEKLGFHVGANVNITGDDRRIVIELADEQTDI